MNPNPSLLISLVDACPSGAGLVDLLVNKIVNSIEAITLLSVKLVLKKHQS